MSCHTPVLDVVPEAEPPVLPAAPGAIKPMRTVALIGPPNSGKSTLFNRLTGLRQKVANYPGVTVEHHSGKMKAIGRGDLTLIDLPGIYSLATYTEDARVAVEVLTGKMRGVPKPDCVLLVLDATHLNRQFMLAAPVFSIGLPTLVLLNMTDELTARGGEIDTLALAKELGHPVALISASENTGLDVIPEFLLRAGSRPDDGLRPVQLPVLQSAASCRTWATQVTARTKYQTPAASLDAPPGQRVAAPHLRPADLPRGGHCGLPGGLSRGTAAERLADGAFSPARSVGRIRTAQQLAAPDAARWRMERRTGGAGLPAADSAAVPVYRHSGRLRLPGARRADCRPHHGALGLQGKAFIPLLSAYACAVPAIMATRTIENKRDRIATIMVAPFMTCSARLPIYTLVIAAFIPNRLLLGVLLGTRALAMLGLYALGFLAALVTARLLNSSILKSDALRRSCWSCRPIAGPRCTRLALRLSTAAKLFVRSAGTIILPCTFAVWVLSILPIHQGQAAGA